jgi:hypothetical protein
MANSKLDNMNEQQIESLFKDFLISKAYPPDSLLQQMRLNERGGRSYAADLIIFDTDHKEYVGLVEFRSRNDEQSKRIVSEQISRYLDIMGLPTLPSYFVCPDEEGLSFQIFQVSKKDRFNPIEKEDFPSFETLSANRITEIMLEKQEREKREIMEFENRKKRAKRSAFWAIFSLIIGLCVSIVAVFYQQKSSVVISQKSNICDNLNIRIFSLQKRIMELEQQRNNVSNLPTQTDTLYLNLNVSKLENRMRIIENGISDNPEKALSLLQIRKEIELQTHVTHNQKKD